MPANPSLPTRSMKWLMVGWSNTGLSMARKQDQRRAMFSAMAELNLLNEEMLYRE